MPIGGLRAWLPWRFDRAVDAEGELWVPAPATTDGRMARTVWQERDRMWRFEDVATFEASQSEAP